MEVITYEATQPTDEQSNLAAPLIARAPREWSPKSKDLRLMPNNGFFGFLARECRGAACPSVLVPARRYAGSLRHGYRGIASSSWTKR
jgi:hypothetical protein